VVTLYCVFCDRRWTKSNVSASGTPVAWRFGFKASSEAGEHAHLTLGFRRRNAAASRALFLSWADGRPAGPARARLYRYGLKDGCTDRISSHRHGGGHRIGAGVDD
jgi:hypothetical protein